MLTFYARQTASMGQEKELTFQMKDPSSERYISEFDEEYHGANKVDYSTLHERILVLIPLFCEVGDFLKGQWERKPETYIDMPKEEVHPSP